MSAPKSADGRTPAEPHPRPLDVCRALLEALDATEGRRRRRKRNTGADAIGIGMKRALLEGAIRDDPDPAEFEGWLLERCFEQGPGEGAWRAMALEIFGEWRMAAAAPSFAEWLRAGAPSDDKPGAGRPERPDRGEGPSRLPVFPGFAPALAALALIGAACEGGIEADVDDVPEIEVQEASDEARQQGGMVAEVLGPLLAGPGPDSTIYDPPLPLARPAGATSWPPPTGTHGDAAARGIRPDTARSRRIRRARERAEQSADQPGRTRPHPFRRGQVRRQRLETGDVPVANEVRIKGEVQFVRDGD